MSNGLCEDKELATQKLKKQKFTLNGLPLSENWNDEGDCESKLFQKDSQF